MLRVIRRSSLTRAEYALASFLQGSVNKRDGDKILIDVDIYLEYINEPYEYCDLWSLVEHYANGFNGLAVFDLKAGDVSINMAATVSVRKGSKSAADITARFTAAGGLALPTPTCRKGRSSSWKRLPSVTQGAKT